jgi:type I restriction-modification system DNA methylase subunit
MQTRNRNTFTTIHTEGALLPSDLLERIRSNDSKLEGLDAQSYHLAPGEKINEAINRSWNRLNGLWGAFQAAREKLAEGDPGTTLSRERWLLPLFQELGFGRLATTKAVEIEGKSYPISHGWQNVPLHLVGCGLQLDKRTPGAAGAARISPHSLLQEYLNRSEAAQWGLVSNGLNLRVLRDNATLTRQAYVEFDLESMFAGEVYSDFVLLWLVCHQSRFETVEKQSECILERWSKGAQESGTRALDDLRRGVEEAILSLGQGFLQHPLNSELRLRLKKGDLSAQDYYRQLLRMVYRLIFLFTAEDRDLLLLPDSTVEAKQLYHDYYSSTRLRSLAERQRGSRHHDRYEALRLVMTLLGTDKGCPELAIPALGGFLFDARSSADLNDAKLDNKALLTAVRSLAFIVEGSTRRAVDYRNLGPEELGSVYESLLELHPLLNIDAGTFQLSSAAGNERKTTGSYYTPSSLIKVLLDSALDPVIEEALKRATVDDGPQTTAGDRPSSVVHRQETTLLNLRVCDPACGSGHFMIAAAHRIAGKLAGVRSGGDEPSPDETRRALRDVIRQCIYGVDINPMAVELCKVNLWLESLEPGKPLSFLDAHIQCGDSLVGVSPNLDISEIPDEAFNPAFGDDKATSTALKKRNKRERGGQFGLFGSMRAESSTEETQQWLAELAAQVDAMPEDDPAQVMEKATAYAEMQYTEKFNRKDLEYNLWTAAFFWLIPKGDAETMLAPSQQSLVALRTGNTLKPDMSNKIRQVVKVLSFFHWELAFPKVFSGDDPGFDCVLGNPPWEKIKLQEEEFFAKRDDLIAKALNKAVRQKLISALQKNNLKLAEEFELAKHLSDASSKFFRHSNRFLLTAVGDINTYPLFVELARSLINGRGRVGIVVPIGISTDDTNKVFFGDLVDKKNLTNLIGFINEENIFLGVSHNFKFCILTLTGSEGKEEKGDFVFYCFNNTHVKQVERHYQLSQLDFSLFNPNTKTCPIFRSRNDYELTRKLYENTPILINDKTNDNPWGARLYSMFHMSNDSNLFETTYREGMLPFYEGKMIYQYDHRFASYESLHEQERMHMLPETTIVDHQNINFSIKPCYYVHKSHVEKKLSGETNKNWLMGFRIISSSGLARTMIFSIIPRVAIGSIPLVFINNCPSENHIACFLANGNSLVLDYIARQKIGGATLNFFIIKQLAFLPPNRYLSSDISYITKRVLELVYTADDLKPFAEDMGYHGEPFRWDEERRAHLRAELDAYYARLYGLTRDELRYILDPKEVYGEDFPGETFRVLKDKEMRLYGEFRTRRLVLEAWDRLEGNMDDGPRTMDDGKPIVVNGQPPAVKTSPPPVSKPVEEDPAPVEESPAQPMLSDFGLYKCQVCGKMVMGYEKGNHGRDVHGGKSVEWKRLK